MVPAGTTQHLTYDQDNQLTGVCPTTACTASTSGWRYSYDPNGNRVSDSLDGAATSYTYDDRDQLTGISHPDGSTTTPSYDTDGNQTSDGTSQLTCTVAARLASVAATDGTTTSYTYAGDGTRTSATSNGATTHYLWDTSGPLPALLADTDTSNTTQHDYRYGLGLLSATSNGATDYPHTDRLGSITTLTDSTGQPVSHTTYDAYGQTASHTTTAGTPELPFGYIGQLRDPATGGYQLNARQYNPATGRFTTTDPLPVAAASPAISTYTYTYSSNQPTVLSDPSGLRGQVGDPGPTWMRDSAGGGWLCRQFNKLPPNLQGVVAAGAAILPLVVAPELGPEDAAVAVEGAGRVAAGARSSDELLAGLNAGTSPGVRVVGSSGDLDDLYTALSEGGETVSNSYPGKFVRLPDGTTVGLRGASRSGGPTIDRRPARSATDQGPR